MKWLKRTETRVKYEMLGLAVKYGMRDMTGEVSVIKETVWSCFVQKVQL